MIIFWIAIVVMTLFALGFLTLPLIFALFQKQQKKGNLITLVSILLILPLLAIGLYWKLGAYESVEKQQQMVQQNKSINAQIQKLGSLQNIVLTLKQKVDTNPDSRGFLLLGRLYLKTQQFKEASDAFSAAYQLAPNQPEILVGYGESLYFMNQQTLTPQAKELLEHALKLQPDQSDAINILAMDAYQRADYILAIHYWEQLLSQFQQGSSGQQKLLEMIGTAHKMAELAVLDGTAAARVRGINVPNQKKATSPSIQLTVHVSLAESFKKQVNPGDTVFIYAQAVKGSKIPLAIVRKQVGNLPLTVTLDETMAMLPTNTLANHTQILIVARISKSGQAIAANGDLQGSSLEINLKHPPARITVVINKALADIKNK